jgi:L-lactate dehydrogenase (cytochrome)
MEPRPQRKSWFGSLRLLRFRGLELNPTRRRLRRGVSVADLRAIARRRLPRGVFDYIDGGAEDELTMAANTEAYRRVGFRPRVLRDVSDIDTTTTLLGKPMSIPLVLAPTGFTRIADPAGELAVARAAARAGVPYALSTLGTRSIEEVAEAGSGRLWFQVYVWRDRGLVSNLVDRAAEAGYEALCVTVDTAVLGKRERDARRGFTLPPKLGISTIFDGIVHPGWTWQFLRSEPILFANLVGRHTDDGTAAIALSDIASQFDPTLSWKDVTWLRERWSGPIVVKGIQTVADAEIAADEGIEAIALSNHGGRQLDSAPAPFGLLPAVSDAVGGRIEIICDGGVRRGSDVVKAIALGATACMAGRAYLYGLGAAGEAGVDHVLGILSSDIRRTMALIGSRTVKEIDREFLDLG